MSQNTCTLHILLNMRTADDLMGETQANTNFIIDHRKKLLKNELN
jgi:hypothetical protein